MATNLITQLMNEFGGETLNRAASALGETPARTESALGAAVPALLGALAGKASTGAGASDLVDLIRQNKFDSRQYGEAASALAAPSGISSLMNVGRPLLDSIFGGRTNSIADWIASSAGINRSSSTSLLAMALPLVLGQITRFGSGGGGGLTASSVQNLLADQRTFLKDAPAGLAGALGGPDFGRPAVVGTYATERAPTQHQARAVGTYQPEARRGSSWWLWAIPLLLLALIPFYFAMRRQAEPERRVVAEAPALPRAEVPTTGRADPAPIVPALGEFTETQLPRGIMLRIPKLGVENKLITYLEDSSRVVEPNTWFSFDRLEFETDSAVLRPSSREQLQNVAEILKAYPSVTAKIGGYTDNAGDAAYNMKLSADRATNTMNELVSLGIDRSRLEAEGYGESHPVADNATEEGRQRNRRIDINVTKK
jgi:outer membrane protein OmpA-like peptidoglycan-associated protein